MTRRDFAGTAASVILPFAARAATDGDVFEAADGDVTVHPVSHASFAMNTPVAGIYVDPVGGGEAYADLPAPDLILVTHQHGDHYDADTLTAIAGDETSLIVNPAVMEMLPEDMKSRATSIANGESADYEGLSVDAIPAYNTTPERRQFHPEGRDNGYVLGFDGLRVYISGDTEDIPEMRALEGIDLAFVCMNLPFTTTSDAAASAVAEFQPKVVYPYHYRGRDGGTQNPEAFAKAVGDAAEVKMGAWYG